MDIQLYQINLDRDDERAYLSIDALARKEQDPKKIKSEIYDCVFKGEVDCETLEDVFAHFNFDEIEGYEGRSMSVSDVVVIREENGNDAAYFCDSVGFARVDFDVELAQQKDERKITVVMLEPGRIAKPMKIDTSLESLQRIVGGYFEAYYPFEEPVCIVCNEEGKINGMPLNRAVYSEPRQIDVTYSEMCKAFRKAEEDGRHMEGYVVFREDSFNKPYSEESRTYVISSNNKAFQAGMGGYSIFAHCLDGTDPCVRLDYHMAVEKGGENGWKIERCYLKGKTREMLDIIAGPCFICDCSGENFGSLSLSQVEKYMEMFRYPEHFIHLNGDIKAIPYNPEKNHER